MPNSPKFLTRTLHGAVLGFGLLGIGICAMAEPSEQTDARKPPSIAASQVGTGNEPAIKRQRSEKLRGESGGATVPAAQDDLEKLRERLAQKLGAIRAHDGKNSNVMRVVSRSSGSTASDREVRDDRGATRNGAAHHAAAHHTASDMVAEQTNPSVSSGAPDHADWDYVGVDGPESWGRLKPEFSKCSSGIRQSPIDIRDGIQVDLDPVQFDYKPSNFTVVDTRRTVQVNLGTGNSIEVMGRRYDLIQFHFHRPSEEWIDGKRFDMVVHLVHKDTEGRLAVVAVLLERGSALSVIQSVWSNLPLEKGEEVSARALLDLREMLPAERGYFTYMGSLTTPPCSEGVLWMVMRKPVPVSAEQIGIFARLYPMNARPIQSAGRRLIKQSN